MWKNYHPGDAGHGKGWVQFEKHWSFLKGYMLQGCIPKNSSFPWSLPLSSMFRVRLAGQGYAMSDHWQRSEKVANYPGVWQTPNLKYTAPGHSLPASRKKEVRRVERLLLFVSGKTGPRMVCRGSNGHPQKASDPWEMGPTSGKSWVLIQSWYSNLSVRDLPLFSPESIQASGDSSLTFLQGTIPLLTLSFAVLVDSPGGGHKAHNQPITAVRLAQR